MKRFIPFLLVLSLILLPVIALAAASGLIPCDGSEADPCTFRSLVELGSTLINFLIMLTIPLVVIAFIYAGFIMLTAGGNEGEIKRAKGIFWTVLKGFLFVLCAWLIVYTITTALLNPDRFTNLLGYIHNYLS